MHEQPVAEGYGKHQGNLHCLPGALGVLTQCEAAGFVQLNDT